jgi:hypothetical protein
MARSGGVSKKAEAAALRAFEKERAAHRREAIARAKTAARAGRKLLGSDVDVAELRKTLAVDLKAVQRLMKQGPPKRRKI